MFCPQTPFLECNLRPDVLRAQGMCVCACVCVSVLMNHVWLEAVMMTSALM